MGQPVPAKLLEERDKLLRQANVTSTPMYDTMKQVAKFPLTKEKTDCIEKTVEKLLDDSLDATMAATPGLLLGNIQCGKTDTFENIIGLAFDKGIDIAIVFTKNNTALTEQTKLRADHDYAAFAEGKRHRVTLHIHDIMDIRSVGLNENTVNTCKTLIVCKKQKDNLDSLSELFTKTNRFLLKKRILIVDDEADFASRNYKKTGRKNQAVLDAKKTTEQIDNFRGLFTDCRYLQVTATPYSLLLQPDGKLNLQNGTLLPFKPRFISLVPIHDKYIGAKQYFDDSNNSDSMYFYLHCGVSQNCMKPLYKSYQPYLTSKGHESMNLFGLENAICTYLMSTAVRRIQEKQKKAHINYHSSAVFHIEIGKDKHDWQTDLISSVVEDIKLQMQSGVLSQWLQRCMAIADHELKASIAIGNKSGLISTTYPTTQEIYDEIKQILVSNNYTIVKVNSDNVIINLLNRQTGELSLNYAANIFVGGNVLDRGITIQNLLCFFYGRNPSSFQQDTVLQHARMFGARSLEDMSVTKFHTTNRIYRAFEMMCEMDADLRERIKKSNQTGEELETIFVVCNSQIKPCAPSKIAASEMNAIKCHQRVLPIGFMSGYKSNISKHIQEIDSLITNSPGYLNKDANGFFEI